MLSSPFFEKWDNGYNAIFKIINNGDTTIDNWYLKFRFNEEIQNVWNGEIYSHVGNYYVIKNVGYNQDIPSGGYVEFGVTTNSRFSE